MATTKMSHTVEFRPLRWLGIVLIACVMAYFFGLASIAPASSAPSTQTTSCTTKLK